MNAAGIDVSCRKSTVAVLRPFGEVVRLPFDVAHSTEGLASLAEQLKALDGETRVVLEHTGCYYEPVAKALHEAGLYVSAVNPLLIKECGANSLRRVKTDKADALKKVLYHHSHQYCQGTVYLGNFIFSLYIVTAAGGSFCKRKADRIRGGACPLELPRCSVIPRAASIPQRHSRRRKNRRRLL